MSNRSQVRWMLILLLITILSSVLHYVDNIAFFHEYPEPHWLKPHHVDAFWFVMTPFGIAGYLLFRKSRRWTAFAAFLIYGAMNLLTLGHYLTAPPWQLSARINFLILFEAAAAVALIAFATISFARPNRFPDLRA